MKISPYWVSIAAIVIGGLMIMFAVSAPEPRQGGDLATYKGLVFAAHILAGGMIVSTGILSLTLLKIFGKNDNEK